MAVYIPMSKINDEGANFITILKAIPPEELLRKQEAVRRIGKVSFGFSIIYFSFSLEMDFNGIDFSGFILYLYSIYLSSYFHTY